MGIIARQSIKGTIATYIGVAIGFVTTFFILTSYLTAEEVGLTRVLVDAATLFSSLALMGTGSSTLRFYPHFKDDSRNQQGLYFWTLVIPFVGFLLFLIAFFAALTFFTLSTVTRCASAIPSTLESISQMRSG